MRYWLAVRIAGWDEVHQQLALADLSGQSHGAALDDLARALGYRRWRDPVTGERRWVHETIWLAAGGGGRGYRHGSHLHRAARLRLAPQRRREIASMGAAARWRRQGESSCSSACR